MNYKQKKEYAFLRALFKYLSISTLWYYVEIFLYEAPCTSLEDSIIGLILCYYIMQCEFRKLNLLP